MELADIVNVIYLIYSNVRSVIQALFEATLVKGAPELAAKFADATTLLITITTIWMIFEFATALKKSVRYVVIIGWGLLLLSIAISILTH